MKPIYLVKDEGHEHLGFYPGYHDESRPARNADMTMERVVELLDMNAEAINAHDFVGCHQRLASLLTNTVGPRKALDVMRRLARHQGLHGLVNACGAGDEEFNKELDKT